MSILNTVYNLIQEDLVAPNDDFSLGPNIEVNKTFLDDEAAMRRLIISKMVDSDARGINRVHNLDGSVTEKQLDTESIKTNLAKLLDNNKLQDMYNSSSKYEFINDFGGFDPKKPYGKIYNY